MPSNISLLIYRGSDADYFSAIEKISNSDLAEQLGLKQVKFHFAQNIAPAIENINVSDVAVHETLTQLFATNGKTIQSMQLTGTGVTIAFRRKQNFNNGETNGHEDEIAINFSGQMESSPDAPQVVALVQDAAKSFSASGVGSILGREAENHFRAREDALTRLETLQANLLRDFESLKKKHYEDIEAKQLKLDNAHQERQEKLTQEHEVRLRQLEQLESELTEKQSKLDDRASTHVRRELREKLKEILTQRQTSFALSKDTRSRRYWVLGGYIGLLVFFLSFAITFVVLEYRNQGESNYWFIGRQIAATIGFFATFGFFLRWMNNWAQQHAEEEFKLRQLEIDIDRASWVVEMAFEWDEAKHSTIPQGLIDKLSTNLFGIEKLKPDEAMTAGDAIAKALAGIPNASAEIDFPGGKIKLDHAALKKVNKDTK